MDESGFDKMIVSQIIKKTEINRTTFYAHYRDKYDLLDKLEDEFLDGITKLESILPTKKILNNDNIDEILPSFSPIFTYLRFNSKLMTLLLEPVKGDRRFISKLTNTIKKNWEDNNMLQKLNIPEGYALSAATGMMSSLIGE